MNYSWDFRVILLYKAAFLAGTILTVKLTASSILLGTVGGVLLALGRLSPRLVFRWPSIAIIETFRALPLLVLLVWLYYCTPILFNVRPGAFLSAAIGMSINLAAFAAETFRAGIEAIPKGYVEAARALGMSQNQTMWRIILPQVTRQMLPPLLGLYITMLKLSSLASVIAVTELLHSANNVITKTFRPLEVYSTVAVIYILIVLPATFLSQRLESANFLERKDF